MRTKPTGFSISAGLCSVLRAMYRSCPGNFPLHVRRRRGVPGASAIDCMAEAIRVDWLGQVVDCIALERRQRMLGMRSDHDRAGLLPRRKRTQHVEAAHVLQLDVEEDHVRAVLVAAVGEAFARHLASMFVATCSASLRTIDAAANAKELSALANHAHLLKGAAANIGAPRLSGAAGRLESAGRCGATDVVVLVRELQRETARVVNYLQAKVDDVRLVENAAPIEISNRGIA